MTAPETVGVHVYSMANREWSCCLSGRQWVADLPDGRPSRCLCAASGRYVWSSSSFLQRSEYQLFSEINLPLRFLHRPRRSEHSSLAGHSTHTNVGDTRSRDSVRSSVLTPTRLRASTAQFQIADKHVPLSDLISFQSHPAIHTSVEAWPRTALLASRVSHVPTKQ